MNLEILGMGGYWQFVWPAFILTFSLCFYVFFKTIAELRSLEKIFKINPEVETIKFIEERKTRKETLPVNSI